MLTSLSDVDISEDGCHSIYMYISKYQSYFPEYEFDIFVKKKNLMYQGFSYFLSLSIFSKVVCYFINRRHIFLVFNLSLCHHNSGWMSCLISFVWFSPSLEKWKVSAKFEMKIIFMCLRRESNQRSLAFQSRSNHMAIETVNDRLLKLWQ